MAYSNIIDAILNEPKPSRAKQASAQLGDVLLDQGNYHTRDRRAHAAVPGDGELQEATRRIASSAPKTLTLVGAMHFAQKLSIKPNSKVGSRFKAEFEAIKTAGRRLERIARKSAAQMQQDGATKLADYADPNKVPGWARQVRADYAAITRFHSRFTPQAKQASTDELLGERSLSDKEVAGYIDGLLNDGVTPREVEAKLEKMAELQVFNRQFATDKLRESSGLAGVAFMEPNTYMDSCPETYQRMTTKLGGVRAASVKQIASCTGCQYFRKDASGKRCLVYRLPIVGSKAELLPIIGQLTAGAKDPKAALVRLANREGERTSTEVKKSSEARGKLTHRVDQKVSIRSSSNRQTQAKPQHFTVSDALQRHISGASIRAIYKEASTALGSPGAKHVLKSFVAGLKQAKASIALTQIDCTLLKAKLGSSNAIAGAAKCASCSYRHDMHCGFTGGTLTSFPGMEKKRSHHRVAAGAPKDGVGMLKEFELTRNPVAEDIDMREPDFGDVELNGISKVDL